MDVETRLEKTFVRDLRQVVLIASCRDSIEGRGVRPSPLGDDLIRSSLVTPLDAVGVCVRDTDGTFDILLV